MKVGILTYHRAHNYGAVLQCYALQEVLMSMGYDAWVIDYKQDFIDNLYKPKFSIVRFAKLLLKAKIKGAVRYFINFLSTKKRNRFFSDFRCNHLHCSAICGRESIPQDFDFYIIGSDQVWGMHCTGGFDPVFWGQFKRPVNSRLIGYAISANGDYNNYLSKEEIVSFFNSFDEISFREEKIRDEIASLSGIKKQISLDPTLLTTQELWKPLLNPDWKKKKFVVVYQIRRSPLNANMINDRAMQYAKKHGCEVVDLSRMDYPVSDFVSAICFADRVFTSSFHATVFSIIFGTPFYSFMLHDGHDGRYVELLKELGLEKNIVDSQSDLENEDPSYSTETISSKIKELKETSILCLKSLMSR